MTDWADDKAEELCWDDVGPYVNKYAVAEALRQARIDALEEAAKLAEDQANSIWADGEDAVCSSLATDIRALKDKQP